MSFTPALKDPAARAHLRMQFGQPAGVPIGAIDSVVITPRGRVAEVAALTVAAQHAGADYVMLSFDGGTNGELYLIEARVADGAGGVAEQRQELLCLDQSWRVPGAVQPTYLSLAEFVARAGLDLSIELTDEDGRGAIDGERLEAALLDAQAEADSYLAGRYQLPLPLPAPAPLPTLIYDRAIARLYKFDVPEQVAKRDEVALRRLRELGEGKAQLAVPAPPAESSPEPVLFRPGANVFSRESLRDL
jgi:phage gp36-like protein